MYYTHPPLYTIFIVNTNNIGSVQPAVLVTVIKCNNRVIFVNNYFELFFPMIIYFSIMYNNKMLL